MNLSIRANRRMKELIGTDLAFTCSTAGLAVYPKLAESAAQIAFRQQTGVLLAADSSRTIGVSDPDSTGTECLINTWHIEDDVPAEHQTPHHLADAGIAFGLALLQKAKLVAPDVSIRAIVSVQEKTDDIPYQGCSVRIHTLRPANSWLTDDLEGYLHEAILTIDA